MCKVAFCWHACTIGTSGTLARSPLMLRWTIACLVGATILAVTAAGQNRSWHHRHHRQRRHVDGDRAVARSPDDRDRSAGRAVDGADQRRRGEADHRRVLRRAAARVVAGRQEHRVPGIPRRHVAHLDGGGRRQQPDGVTSGPVRRSRAALVARRQRASPSRPIAAATTTSGCWT